jgi:muramoyltetrapeptide carboxypeptidase
MAHIYIFSPSSAVRDKAAFRRGLKRLQAQGHTLEVDEAALASHMRFAGDDATRIAAIGRAASSGADVALISRGGYGLSRILADLPYKAIAKAIDQGTQFVGLSDFTAFNQAVMAKTGRITWQGPALGEDFGTEAEPDDIMQACFDDVWMEQGEGTGWQLPKAEAEARAARPVRLHNATLWGGNLTVLTSLLGTPYFPQVQGGVLFLEDVGEHPYRVERMLTQWLHAGVLARQKAVIFGQFTQYKLVPAHDKGFKLPTVVDWLRSQIKTPVLTGLPFGHVPTKVMLPVGAKVDLVSEGRDALMVWGHI